jgi:hypothetical protein
MVFFYKKVTTSGYVTLDFFTSSSNKIELAKYQHSKQFTRGNLHVMPEFAAT